jgi:hypothetical protein
MQAASRETSRWVIPGSRPLSRFQAGLTVGRMSIGSRGKRQSGSPPGASHHYITRHRYALTYCQLAKTASTEPPVQLVQLLREPFLLLLEPVLLFCLLDRIDEFR